jgi:hypothetical protein
MKSFCKKCKIEYHNEKKCEELQKDKKFDQEYLITFTNLKYKQCEKCKFWIEKNGVSIKY